MYVIVIVQAVTRTNQLRQDTHQDPHHSAWNKGTRALYRLK